MHVEALTVDVASSGEILPIMEQFYTLQGEGFNAGMATYFIRIAGCDVGCHWCDVKESWDGSKHPLHTISQLIDAVSLYPAPAVVITGGEPALYNLHPLTTALKTNGYQTFIETSGSSTLNGIWDWICVSPKKFKPALPQVLAMAHELKVVIFNKADFVWAQSFIPFLSPDCKLYLQPEWGKKEIILPLIVEFIKENPRWRLSLQTHKYINIP